MISSTPAYILHVRPFKESSGIVECFTLEQGIISAVGKGIKRVKSRWFGLAQPFIHLEIAWVGKGDLKTLTHMESSSILPILKEQKLWMGLYLNELLIKLLQKYDPHPELFHIYEKTIKNLSHTQNDQDAQIVLRKFECGLLAHLGYGFSLTHDHYNGREILPELIYSYDPQMGLYELSTVHDPKNAFSGASILALSTGDFQTLESLQEAKRLMRRVIAYYLGEQSLESRKLFVTGMKIT